MEIVLAIFDFVPVILCFISMVILQVCLYDKMKKYQFALLASGSIMVLTAGVLKAIWKLFYYGLNIDIYRFNYLFFPVQGIGFVLTFVGVLMMFIDTRKANGITSNPLGMIFLAGAEPAVEAGKTLANDTMLYVCLQILGSAGLYACLVYIAVKLKKKWLIAIISVALICMLGMGYMSTKISRAATEAEYVKYNWMAEIINTIGQCLFLLTVLVFKKNGLKEKEF